MTTLHRTFRKLETCGKPVVAAINGTALGGGLETRARLPLPHRGRRSEAPLGFPEAQVGLIPGGGGTQRLPRLIGAMDALPFMLEGKRIDPKAALAMGIVHKVVPAGELIAQAKAWIKGKPDCDAALGQEGIPHSRRRPVLDCRRAGVHRRQRHAAARRPIDNYPGPALHHVGGL